jgi:hypothetical protein
MRGYADRGFVAVRSRRPEALLVSGQRDCDSGEPRGWSSQSHRGGGVESEACRPSPAWSGLGTFASAVNFGGRRGGLVRR